MQERTKKLEHLSVLVARLGPLRAALLSVLLIMPFTMLADFLIHTRLVSSDYSSFDLLSSFLLTPLSILGAMFCFTLLISRLSHSRQHFAHLAEELDMLRKQDELMKGRLRNQIDKLEREIGQRQQAEQARVLAIHELEQMLEKEQQTEQKLLEQSNLLRSILDTSPDLIYYRDEAGRFAACNKPMEQLTGFAESKLKGHTPDEIYPAEIAEQILATDRQVLERDTALSYEQWMKAPDGRQVLYEFRKVPFYDTEGQRLGLLGFGRDVTERQKNSDALRKANKQRLTFISTISHELRTPLNGIIGLSRMLKDTPLNEQQQSYVESVHLSAVTLSSIFNDIVDLDKLERRRLQVVPRPVELAPFWRDITNLGQLMAKDRQLGFHASQQLGGTAWLALDDTRLRQVMWNLLSNAVKFTERGEITVSLRTTALSKYRDRLELTVRDTGCGIAQEELEKIFGLYYQGQKVTSRYASGSGIGLSVARQLVQAMGGKLQVESTVGEGSCFTVSLEVRHAEPVTAADDTASEPPAIPALNILLVEDIELNVMVAKALLEKLGHTVDVAMNGSEGLHKARQAASMQGTGYDLLLLDIQLPDISGYEVARVLQESEQTSSLPIVAFTANGPAKKQHYLDAGMVDVLAKPLDPDALDTLLSRHRDGFKLQQLESSMSQSTQYQEFLNLDMLEQYYDLVGASALEKSVGLFEDLMPGYMQILESHLAAKDTDAVASEAHKIKGAASSVGLKRIQELAQQAQTPSLPNWEQDIDDWVSEISRHYAADLTLLKQWLADKQA